jgi:hypothetical protein
MKTLQLVFWQQKFPPLLVWKIKHSKIWPYKIVGVLYFPINLYVEPDIRPAIRYPASPDIQPDIRYLVFRLAGYPAGRISGQISIRCIPNKNWNKLQPIPVLGAYAARDLFGKN